MEQYDVLSELHGELLASCIGEEAAARFVAAFRREGYPEARAVRKGRAS